MDLAKHQLLKLAAEGKERLVVMPEARWALEERASPNRDPEAPGARLKLSLGEFGARKHLISRAAE